MQRKNNKTYSSYKRNESHPDFDKVETTSKRSKIVKKYRCSCCNLEFPGNEIRLRLPTIYTFNNELRTRYVKVCKYCNSYYDDSMLRKYQLEITNYPVSWLTGSYNLTSKSMY